MSPGKYLLITSALYLIVGLLNIWLKFCPAEVIQVVGILVIAVPLVVKPLGHWVGVKGPWKDE